MSKDEKKQTFFQPVEDPRDLADLFEFLVGTHGAIMLKDSQDKNANAPLTEVEIKQFKGSLLSGKRKSGPAIEVGTSVTLVFEQSGAKFFGVAQLKSTNEDLYDVSVKNLFKLQRRDSFRVTIPHHLIKAQIIVAKKQFTLIDFSAGGCAFHVSLGDAPLFEMDSLLNGFLAVDSSDPVEVAFKVKFRRKSVFESKEGLQIGCEFTDTSIVFNQKMQFLVNECQRHIILKMGK